MNMKTTLGMAIAAAAIMMASCQSQREKDNSEDRSQQKIDSLERVIAQSNSETEDLARTIQDIRDGFRKINEAEGRAKEILLVAEAQAAGIRKVAEAIGEKGGLESVNMQLAQQYLNQFGNLAKTNNTMIIPSDLANVAGVLKACTSIVKKVDVAS